MKQTIELAAIILFAIVAGGLQVWLSDIIDKHRKNKTGRNGYDRAIEVKAFRINVINDLGVEAYNSLPTFDEMVQDGKELIYSNYIK